MTPEELAKLIEETIESLWGCVRMIGTQDWPHADLDDDAARKVLEAFAKTLTADLRAEIADLELTISLKEGDEREDQ